MAVARRLAFNYSLGGDSCLWSGRFERHRVREWSPRSSQSKQHLSYRPSTPNLASRVAWDRQFIYIRDLGSGSKLPQAHLTATPTPGINGSHGTPASIAVTTFLDDGTKTNFYVARHANFTSLEKHCVYNHRTHKPRERYNTSAGGKLTLNGRDSKFHGLEYDLAGMNPVYSSAEIFRWARGAGSTRVLILYGGTEPDFALSRRLGNPTVVQGDDDDIRHIGATSVI
ncbi:uncharacterized protein N7443_000947 [Penicillium atrosanguineum]|uniref:uncharacterized protein n=1 Tax=Penicillium atrosanguineum TaxID=1132637 RepID=UPI0023A210F7|nr:uncharacterized protein N7443_000947 [Penicillium atrosanguineum]KAJ5314063.1 hypothetical protein N7443_000947 [Penicillium atrosanguineum]